MNTSDEQRCSSNHHCRFFGTRAVGNCNRRVTGITRFDICQLNCEWRCARRKNVDALPIK